MPMEDAQPLPPHTLAKQAWHMAYNGDYAAARDCLHAAAQQGDLVANAFLASSYRCGTLITPIDQNQSALFQQFVDKQIASRAPGSDLVERLLQRKSEAIGGHDFARRNQWYQELEGALKTTPLCAKKKSFHFPIPETGLEQLLPSLLEDKLHQYDAALVIQGIKEVNSEKLYKIIFERFYSDQQGDLWHRSLLTHNKKLLLRLLHDWFITQGHPLDALGEWKLADIYRGEINLAQFTIEVKKTWELPANLVKLTPSPLESRNEASQIVLELSQRLAQIRTTHSLDWDAILGTSQPGLVVTLLNYIQHVHRELFQRSCAELLQHNLRTVLKLALTNPHVWEALADTPLNLKNLIEQSCNGEHDGAFELFLQRGQAFHETYQERIVSVFVSYLQRDDFGHKIELLTSLNPSVGRCVFQALTENITSHELSSKQASHLKFLLALDLESILGAKNPLEVYTYFYQACLKNNCVTGLQVLWNQLAKSNDIDKRVFLKVTITAFFNVKLQESWTSSFELLLNRALDMALSAATVHNNVIKTFLICANQSSLTEHIRPAFLERFKSQSLLQQEMSLKERCQFLDDLLTKHAVSDRNYKVISLKVALLEEGVFKEYARTVLATLNPSQTSYEYFANRRKLKTLHDSNADLDDQPQSIKSIEIPFFNAFEPIESQAPGAPLIVHKYINDKLFDAQLDETLVFGYVFEEHSYGVRLYACDSADGYPRWASPFLLPYARPFVVKGDCVYCVNGENNLTVFDKYRGAVISTIKLPLQEKIKDIYVTPDKMLFALYENSLYIIDLQKRKYILKTLPRHNSFSHWFNGDKLMIVCGNVEQDKVCLIIDQAGSEQIVMLEATKESFLSSVLVLMIGQNMFLHTTDDGRIILLDLTTGKKMWEYCGQQGRPQQLLKMGNRLLLLTEKSLSAFDISKLSVKGPQLLWQTSSMKSDHFTDRTTNIVGSDDGAFVCGLCNGSLYCFDIQNGTRRHLYDLTMSSSWFLGAYKGILYVK